MDTILLGGLVLGLVEVTKITLGITKRFIPLTALFLSLAIFGLYAYLSGTAIDWTIVSTALVTALTAVGLWSGTKSTLG